MMDVAHLQCYFIFIAIGTICHNRIKRKNKQFSYFFVKSIKRQTANNQKPLIFVIMSTDVHKSHIYEGWFLANLLDDITGDDWWSGYTEELVQELVSSNVKCAVSINVTLDCNLSRLVFYPPPSQQLKK
jgi:hypothetical protein